MSLDVTDLCVHYGDYCALHDFNLAARPGEFIGIVGPNGGGKTTLLRAVLGLMPSAHGRLEVGAPVAYVAQDAIHTNPHVPISVLEFTSLGRLDGKYWRRARPADHQRVQEALNETGVWHLRDRRLSTLSGGQRQRVHLAQALCQDAKMLLLDEPTTGIDRRSRDDLYQLLRHLCRDHAITVLMVSHDNDTLAKWADRMVVVDKTKQFDGGPDAYRAWTTSPGAPETHNPYGAHAPPEAQP